MLLHQTVCVYIYILAAVIWNCHSRSSCGQWLLECVIFSILAQYNNHYFIFIHIHYQRWLPAIQLNIPRAPISLIDVCAEIINHFVHSLGFLHPFSKSDIFGLPWREREGNVNIHLLPLFYLWQYFLLLSNMLFLQLETTCAVFIIMIPYSVVSPRNPPFEFIKGNNVEVMC